jgi:transposase
VETHALASPKKNAARQRRIIVFVDESGLSERPTRVRTWAPKGQTPVLQYSFNWKQLSAMAGVTWWQFYFRLFPGSIRGPQVVEFLKALRRHIRHRLLIIWDGLRAHKSRLVQAYLEAQRGGVQVEFLPAYAPELNPVEYLWGYLKAHEVSNLCVANFGQLTTFARNRLRSPRAPTHTGTRFLETGRATTMNVH